ncbi:MAG TPA: ABC transporter ATP-binding protein [Pseudonocardiaceae bacterium]|jgi:oligopeptide/dipeptide ABC transporter ATP-binding protein|nr:ABC transporter ATP-binding protein [Pseudonocardiaceae bacterium]
MTLLEVEDLSVVYEPTGAAAVHSVRNVSLSLRAGEFVGLVGESGCGKSTLGYALTRMLRPPARLDAGRVLFEGTDIAALRGERLRRMRQGGFALVLQSGMNALNPVRTVADHFVDVLRAHGRIGKAATRTRATELLDRVYLPASTLRRYPHELSGGMRQRVVIALVLALEPRLVVFDEPTTALDVLVQKAVIDTVKELQSDVGFSALLISHDLGLVLESADRVLVMYAGRIVEDQPAARMVRAPEHPYTRALLRCYADPRADEVAISGIPGSPPDLSQPSHGCSFAPRCPLAEPACRAGEPPLTPIEGDASVACVVAVREAAS